MSKCLTSKCDAELESYLRFSSVLDEAFETLTKSIAIPRSVAYRPPHLTSLAQDDEHYSYRHPISENPKGSFFERDIAQSGEADGEHGGAPEMEEVQGIEDLVERSSRTHIRNEQRQSWSRSEVAGRSN